MHVTESQWISENCKDRKRQAILFSDAITLTLTVEKLKSVHKRNSSDRCLQDLNLLCCWQLSTLYTCNNFSTLSGTYGWSTRGSSIWPVLFVQLLLNTWCLSLSELTEELCKSRDGCPGWAFRPTEPYGFCGRKATLNHAYVLVSACP